MEMGVMILNRVVRERLTMMVTSGKAPGVSHVVSGRRPFHTEGFSATVKAMGWKYAQHIGETAMRPAWLEQIKLGKSGQM